MVLQKNIYTDTFRSVSDYSRAYPSKAIVVAMGLRFSETHLQHTDGSEIQCNRGFASYQLRIVIH